MRKSLHSKLFDDFYLPKQTKRDDRREAGEVKRGMGSLIDGDNKQQDVRKEPPLLVFWPIIDRDDGIESKRHEKEHDE